LVTQLYASGAKLHEVRTPEASIWAPACLKVNVWQTKGEFQVQLMEPCPNFHHFRYLW